MNKNYVLGFMFNPEMTKVVLIKKMKPDFQKNKLNGVGGKIEEKEHPRKAMVREFQEETGILTQETDWSYCGKFTEVINTDHQYSGQAVIFVFKCISDKGDEAKTLTEEPVRNYFINELIEYNLMKSLNWILPLLSYQQKTNFDVLFF